MHSDCFFFDLYTAFWLEKRDLKPCWMNGKARRHGVLSVVGSLCSCLFVSFGSGSDNYVEFASIILVGASVINNLEFWFFHLHCLDIPFCPLLALALSTVLLIVQFLRFLVWISYLFRDIKIKKINNNKKKNLVLYTYRSIASRHLVLYYRGNKSVIMLLSN